MGWLGHGFSLNLNPFKGLVGVSSEMHWLLDFQKKGMRMWWLS